MNVKEMNTVNSSSMRWSEVITVKWAANLNRCAHNESSLFWNRYLETSVVVIVDMNSLCPPAAIGYLPTLSTLSHKSFAG